MASIIDLVVSSASVGVRTFPGAHIFIVTWTPSLTLLGNARQPGPQVHSLAVKMICMWFMVAEHEKLVDNTLHQFVILCKLHVDNYRPMKSQ